MPFPRGLPGVLLGHDVILNFSYDTATHPKFPPLLMGGRVWGKLSAFLGQKIIFAPISPL